MITKIDGITMKYVANTNEVKDLLSALQYRFRLNGVCIHELSKIGTFCEFYKVSINGNAKLGRFFIYRGFEKNKKTFNQLYMKFNHSKIGGTIKEIIIFINNYFKNSGMVHVVDLAHDTTIPKENLFVQSSKKKIRNYLGTEYHGQRSDHGSIKMYDKKLELDEMINKKVIHSHLTRLEVTIKGQLLTIDTDLHVFNNPFNKINLYNLVRLKENNHEICNFLRKPDKLLSKKNREKKKYILKKTGVALPFTMYVLKIQLLFIFGYFKECFLLFKSKINRHNFLFDFFSITQTDYSINDFSVLFSNNQNNFPLIE
ncbi:hypothetical protein [Gottfriedia acidiceleris]|uniref:LAGLIDADG homing endonuclease n=1 Tax=Gottfriedia acidiceleris TaxID=371036 RepID=A0ABY4JF14_9BACI|nr:hypothetical protein [Gottfriedia acidiceleris]UPM52439.1 hypothetical protein MY490_11340 [Gottfriedia acidiceleris]